MPSPMPPLSWLAVLFPLLLAGGYAYGPISRSRVQAFARHARVTITADNGDQVIRYLAITRRWRCAGLGTGAAITVAQGLPHGQVGVNFLALFAGWFVGALFAELHLATAIHSTRRAASLDPRTPRRYVSHFVWRLLPFSAVVLAVPWLAGLHPLLWTLLGAAILGSVAFVRRRVLHRPQPPLSTDVVRSDDAVRARSLHVLSGGGFALTCFCGLASFDPGAAAVAGLAVLIVGAYAAAARGPLPPFPVTA